MTAPAGDAAVDGVDVDAVATAVRSVEGVDDLDAGTVGRLATYLPGREVAGVRVDPDVVTVQVRADGRVALPELGVAVQARLRPLVGHRRTDVLISDITLPGAREAGGL